MKTAVKMKMVPAPNGIDPITGPIQWTCLYVVNAMMYSPMRYSVRKILDKAADERDRRADLTARE